VWRSSEREYNELPRSDGWELDHGYEAWQRDVVDQPIAYMDAETPQLEIQTAPATSHAGVLEVLYVALGDVLSNTGIAFTVPQEFVPSIKWGVLADMLSKVGQAHDPARATYAEARFQEGVVAAQLMLRGWA
jgi:hypothetical protein